MTPALGLDYCRFLAKVEGPRWIPVGCANPCVIYTSEAKGGKPIMSPQVVNCLKVGILGLQLHKVCE